MYADYENSNAGGFPVELFEFLVDGATYRYAHHDDDVELLDDTFWESGMVHRSQFSKGAEVEQASITLTVNSGLPMLQIFSDGIPESSVQLTVFRVHLTDPDLEPWVVWIGEVTSLKRKSRQIQLKCDPPEALLRSVGLRRRYQSSCPYPLYGNGCLVNREDFTVTATVVSVSGTTIRVNVPDCSIYIGGIMTFTDTLISRYRHIVSGSGDSIVVTRPVSWLMANNEVDLARGCNKTLATCRGVFNNLYRYGGLPHIPVSNVFNTKVF